MNFAGDSRSMSTRPATRSRRKCIATNRPSGIRAQCQKLAATYRGPDQRPLHGRPAHRLASLRFAQMAIPSSAHRGICFVANLSARIDVGHFVRQRRDHPVVWRRPASRCGA